MACAPGALAGCCVLVVAVVLAVADPVDARSPAPSPEAAFEKTTLPAAALKKAHGAAAGVIGTLEAGVEGTLGKLKDALAVAPSKAGAGYKGKASAVVSAPQEDAPAMAPTGYAEGPQQHHAPGMIPAVHAASPQQHAPSMAPAGHATAPQHHAASMAPAGHAATTQQYAPSMAPGAAPEQYGPAMAPTAASPQYGGAHIMELSTMGPASAPAEGEEQEPEEAMEAPVGAPEAEAEAATPNSSSPSGEPGAAAQASEQSDVDDAFPPDSPIAGEAPLAEVTTPSSDDSTRTESSVSESPAEAPSPEAADQVSGASVTRGSLSALAFFAVVVPAVAAL